MASVSKRVRDTQTTYVVRWRDDQGRQRKKSFARKVDADRFRAEVEHTLHAGTYIDTRAGMRPFREVAEEWRLAQPHRPTTVARVATQMNRHVYPAIGHRPIGAIRRSELQALVTEMARSLAASTTRMVFISVRSVFRAAILDRIIAVDPSVQISLPEVSGGQLMPLTPEQVAVATRVAPAPFGPLILAGAGLGLRQAELFGLKVEDLDFLRGTVRVQRQILAAPGGGTREAPLKTRSAYRTVPLSSTVRDALALHLRDHPARDGLVFTGPEGHPLRRGWVNDTIWWPVRRELGVDCGMHALRHFYASALIRAGRSVKTVSTMLGHANAAITLNVYSHLWPDEPDLVRQAIDDVLGHAPPVRPAESG